MLRQASTVLKVDTAGRGFTEITREVGDWLSGTGVTEGILHLLCRHTSASLLIQENAARAVRHDLADWLERLAPEGDHYVHDDEGPDDMPAHLRATLTGVTLSIPVMHGSMALGIWQGIYLAEHRCSPHRREVAIQVSGE